LNVSTGPNAVVIGASSSPGSSREVFHITLTPSGTLMWVVNSGFRPCSRACGVQRRNHMNRAPSLLPGPMLVEAGDAQFLGNTVAASARQTSRLARLGKASTAARRHRGRPGRSVSAPGASTATPIRPSRRVSG
jgi:hypothetical protein